MQQREAPPLQYAQRVIDAIHAIDDPSVDMDTDHADINAAALHDLPLDNDFLATEAYDVYRLAYCLNKLNLGGILIDRGTRLLVKFEYDEIFEEFVARRGDRPSRQPMEEHRIVMMRWLNSVQSTRDLDLEVGDARKMYALLQDFFIPMVRDHLPEKLDLKSWVGELAKQKLQRDETGDLLPGEVVFWEPNMGPVTTATQEEQCRLNHDIPFVGTGGEGRLVWRYLRWGMPPYDRPRAESRRIKVEQLIARTEENLVRLSIQIANWLAYFLVATHARERVSLRGRRSLSGADIIRAVNEILGDAWFELPFDSEGKLKEWKMQRTLCIDREDCMHVLEE